MMGYSNFYYYLNLPSLQPYGKVSYVLTVDGGCSSE